MVEFKGNTDWEQSAEIEWSVDNWGVDHAKVLYRGRRTAKEAFENKIRRWSSLPNFPKVLLAGWQGTNITPSFPGIEFGYVGFRSGTPPPRRAIRGVSIQTANGEGIDTASGQQVSGTFTYLASRTSWYWFETKVPPLLCPYPQVLDNTDPLSRIIRYSIQVGDTGRTTNSIPYSSFVAVFNSLRRGAFVSDYICEQINPDLWACSADVDYKIL